jgi:hypothetical protein
MRKGISLTVHGFDGTADMLQFLDNETGFPGK